MDKVDIWHGRVAADAAEAAAFRSVLSADELARADRFRFPELQQKFAQRRGILRFLLADYLNVEPQAIRFRHNMHGKPFLCGSEAATSGLQFSLSHSKDWMLVAVAYDRDLGVDIEAIRDDIDFFGLAQSFFASEDVAAIAAQPDLSRQRQMFFEIWTGKEAYVKAIGEGLSIPLNQFCISLSNDKLRLQYAHHQQQAPIHGLAARWNFERLAIDESTRASLAYTGSQVELQFQSLNSKYAVWKTRY